MNSVAESKPETSEQILQAAEAWYMRQLELLAKVHGSHWPANRAWVEAYLREEIRERLIARGWRPRK